VIVISVLTYWIGESYTAGIGGPVVVSGFLFFVALIVSVMLQQKK
jgi:hypothetical protein